MLGSKNREDKKVIDMSVAQIVKGLEGFNLKVDWSNTNLKTVIMVQIVQLQGFLKILYLQLTKLDPEAAAALKGE